MKIKTLSTGSSGNCYILTNDNGKHLIIDAGLPIADIKKGLNFDIGNVDGCIISHRHKDHELSASKIENMAIRVYRPYEIDIAILKTQIGDFKVSSFPLPHNGTKNRGFLIECEKHKLLYMTDFEYVAFNFYKDQINTMLIECNYQADMIAENDHKEHTCLGHAELSTVADFVSVNATHALETVILCHASNSGCLDRENAVNTIQAIVPKAKVYMATKGMTIEI